MVGWLVLPVFAWGRQRHRRRGPHAGGQHVGLVRGGAAASTPIGRGVRLGTYATFSIRAHLLAVALRQPPPRRPRALARRTAALPPAARCARARRGGHRQRRADRDVIAAELEVDPALRGGDSGAARRLRGLAFDLPGGTTGGRLVDELVADATLPDEACSARRVRELSVRDEVARFRSTLEGRKREVFDARWSREESLSDLGRRVGMSGERASVRSKRASPRRAATARRRAARRRRGELRPDRHDQVAPASARLLVSNLAGQGDRRRGSPGPRRAAAVVASRALDERNSRSRKSKSSKRKWTRSR